ncbi:hypothetical protein [Brachybacterium sp. UMB0905]|uniref:hypothetical protein n=1 Tax=Brachybacterium sp. UMB0905 TaxID=2069310 RepID=UPI000C80690F|nr:hypothetical protein [Brachybacterium sp. UMB0905]PMC75534.1 hypothetical protein CJ197_07230 [Brachybacterium sp. UMB0905]
MTRRCTAHTSSGQPCKKPPIRGGTACTSHGGSSPRVRAAAERRLAEQDAEAKAAQAVERLTGKRAPMNIADVYRELLELSGLVVAWKDVLRDRVDALTDYTTPTLVGGEQIRGDVLLFERAMDRALKVLDAVARLDLDSRLSVISEEGARQIVAMIRRAVADVDFTPEQEDRFNAAIARELRRASEAGDTQ